MIKLTKTTILPNDFFGNGESSSFNNWRFAKLHSIFGVSCFSEFQPGPYLLLLGGRGGAGCTFPILATTFTRHNFKKPTQNSKFQRGPHLLLLVGRGQARRDVHFITILVTTFMDDYRHNHSRLTSCDNSQNVLWAATPLADNLGWRTHCLNSAGPDTRILLSSIFCCNSTSHYREMSSIIYYL